MKKNYLLILSLVLLTGLLLQGLAPRQDFSTEENHSSSVSGRNDGAETFVCNPFLSKF